jgi:hypothetical protein
MANSSIINRREEIKNANLNITFFSNNSFFEESAIIIERRVFLLAKLATFIFLPVPSFLSKSKIIPRRYLYRAVGSFINYQLDAHINNASNIISRYVRQKRINDTAFLIIRNTELKLDFAYEPVNPIIYQPVYFFDTSTVPEGIVEWDWDFGNYTYDHVKNPVAIYQEPGFYTVVMRITDSYGYVYYVRKRITIMADTYSPQVSNLLLEQFRKTAPNLINMLRAFGAQVSLIEDQLALISSSFNLTTATGHQLDILGEEVGEKRYERNDTDYREAIQFTIFYNQATGTPEHVIACAIFLSSATNVRYIESHPAKIILNIENGTISDITRFRNKLQAILPIGVGLEITQIQENPFVFFGDSDGNGFGDLTDEDIGGNFVTLI